MRKLISDVFREAINKKFVDTQHESVRIYLLNHPARETMFDNLEREIKAAGTVLNEMTGDMHKKRESIRIMVESVTNIFIKAAIAAKEKELKNAT
jgi:hypothetical protein